MAWSSYPWSCGPTDVHLLVQQSPALIWALSIFGNLQTEKFDTVALCFLVKLLSVCMLGTAMLYLSEVPQSVQIISVYAFVFHACPIWSWTTQIDSPMHGWLIVVAFHFFLFIPIAAAGVTGNPLLRYHFVRCPARLVKKLRKKKSCSRNSKNLGEDESRNREKID